MLTSRKTLMSVRAGMSAGGEACGRQPAGEFGPGGDAELAVGAGQVELAGADAQKDRLADLAIGSPRRHQQGDLQFLGRPLLAHRRVPFRRSRW